VRRILAIAVLVVTSLTLSVSPARAAGIDAAAMELNRFVAEYGLPGGVAVIRDGASVVQQAAGYSDVDTGAGFAPNTHVRVASITKTFVAATVLQLVAEGRVNLDAPIETYLPGRIRGEGIDGNAITVRQLLRHQSGLPEYFENGEQPSAAPRATPDQLVDFALAKPALFAPGAQMRYTNTNYIVAGLLIQAVTGRSAADEITWRILLPLGLFETYFPAPGDTWLRAPFAHGCEEQDGRRVDVTAFPASEAGMAGSMVSTGADTTAFITALLDGRIVPRAQLDQMMQTVPRPGKEGMSYGLGLTKVSLPCGVTAWGHGGDIPGFHSVLVKTLDGPAYSVTLTQEPAAGSPTEDPQVALLSALYC
jgi:D-alanyl-D-alanine carboxypeptidase